MRRVQGREGGILRCTVRRTGNSSVRASVSQSYKIEKGGNQLSRGLQQIHVHAREGGRGLNQVRRLNYFAAIDTFQIGNQSQ